MSTRESLSAGTRDRIESFVDECMVDDDVPGMSVALVSEDEVLYANGFGARDLSENKPMTLDTLYGIGSCTKSFTTLGVMRLAEEGSLDVDDPVNDYVSVYEEAPGEQITIHDLMCHGSGMPSDATAVALITRYVTGEPMATPLSDRDDFARHVRSSLDTRAVERAEPFFYYNSGYTVLGEVIETVSGKPYREYVREEILTPLGMHRSTFDEEAVEEDDDAMTGYYKDDGDLVEGSFPHDSVIDAPGGLLSSVREMTKYLQMQMNGGETEGSRLVTEDSVTAMHTPYTTREVRLDGTQQEYGYGWMIQEFLNDRLVEHGGTISVSTGYLGFLEEAGLGVVVGSNTASNVHPMFVGPAILSIASGEDPTEVPFFALREKAKTVAGTYESHRGLVEATVEQNGAALTLSIGDQEYGLHPKSTDTDDLTYETVTPSGATAPVEFECHGDGVDLFFQRWRLRRTDA